MNISLDTLQPDRFEFLLQINVVVMRGVNDDEICDFVEMTRASPINVRFIEYMPFDGNVWSHQKMVSYKDMLQAIAKRYPQGLKPLKVNLLLRWAHPEAPCEYFPLKLELLLR